MARHLAEQRQWHHGCGYVPGTGTKDYCYGVYLGNTFKDLPNITWMSGNDFQTYTTAADNDDALAVAEGIQSTDGTALQTSELNYTVSSSLDSAAWASTLSLNGAYTYAPTYAEVLHAYNQSSLIPTFMTEANYEGEQNGGTDGCIAVRNCRLQEWWTMTRRDRSIVRCTVDRSYSEWVVCGHD